MDYEVTKPVPDFWMQSSVFLHTPNPLLISQYLCKHDELNPSYKDVYIKPRKNMAMNEVEKRIYLGEDYAESN
jgi:hypothetical protein